MSKVFRPPKLPMKNITTDERQALRNLQKMKDITVLPVDKGNATVVIDFEEYNHKIEDLLNDPSYESITTDPTKRGIAR